jgi:hypothetical protein
LPLAHFDFLITMDGHRFLPKRLHRHRCSNLRAVFQTPL